VKLAVVVQRYGAEINGGAELHARYIAEHLSPRHDVEVLTTCARDYVTWANELPAGEESVHGIRVRRFPVDRPRDPDEFGARSRLVFGQTHSLADELAWLRSEGPSSPALVGHVKRQAGVFDFLLFFSYRYYHAYWGARAVPQKAILVPTAERDSAVGLAMFQPVLRGVRALMYNSPEERAMLQAAAGTAEVPGVVVGVGSDVPPDADAHRFRAKHGISGPYLVYVGRIDENKGCKELFDFFSRYRRWFRSSLSLVLIGKSLLPIPDAPWIRHLGFVDERDKYDAIAGAEALVIPSYFESLSMVTLEAWAMGRPVLANAACDVLRGQCSRSNAGLYYASFDEFAEALQVLESNVALNLALGQNGREYFRRHYAWPVIERKYDEMLSRLADEDRSGGPGRTMDRLPGFFARRARTLPPADTVLDSLPAGPADPPRPHARVVRRRRGGRS
jgi:glycosyltransferase involved in cell wall biosynthesis